jgi:hypothetical protein
MATTFVRVGAHYVNMDLVASVEMIFSQQPGQEAADPGQPTGARIHYTTGSHQDFLDTAAAQQLDAWLKAHQAP